MTSKNDFPSFRRTDPAIGFSFTSEKANSRQGYEAAVAEAFIRARELGAWKKTGRESVALLHFIRLIRRVS